MAKVVRGLKSGFLNIVGALKCGGRPTTVEPPLSPTPATTAAEKSGEIVYVGETEKHEVVHIGEAREDLYVEASEFETVQVMRMIRSREPTGVPKGSRPGTG
ncbi:hypothetical protein LINGRAHAP2_LOCUS16382 [Linum grandiflorum]